MFDTNATLIPADSTILLWAVVLLIVAVSIFLEQRFKWAAALSSCVLCIFLGLACSNLHIIPYSSDVFTGIGSVVLLCAIPLMLFKANIKDIIKNSGKLFIMFHIAAVGAVLGVLLAFVILGRFENTPYLLTIIQAGAIGGTVNCVAMGTVFEMPEGLLDAYLVIGNFAVGCMIIGFRVLHNAKFIKKFLPRPHTEAMEATIDTAELEKSGKTLAAAFWGGSDISLKDIAIALAATFTIVGVSNAIATWVLSLNPPTIIAQLFGSVYLIMTIITAFCATVFSKFFGNIKGSLELGNIAILIWFVTVGISGNLKDIFTNGLLSLALFVVVVAVVFAVAIVGAKLIKATWEDAVIAITASVGGPPTAAAVGVSFGWNAMIVPGILMGLWGYLIGNYFGILAGNIMGVPTLM